MTVSSMARLGDRTWGADDEEFAARWLDLAIADTHICCSVSTTHAHAPTRARTRPIHADRPMHTLPANPRRATSSFPSIHSQRHASPQCLTNRDD